MRHTPLLDRLRVGDALLAEIPRMHLRRSGHRRLRPVDRGRRTVPPSFGGRPARPRLPRRPRRRRGDRGLPRRPCLCDGVRRRGRARARQRGPLRAGEGGTLAVSDGWLGRVVDPIGRPMDGKGALPRGAAPRRVRANPPEATLRARLGPRIDLGVRVLNAFATCRQRPAARPVRRLRRRQIHPARHARPADRVRRRRPRPGRRARPRGARVHRGRARPGGPRPLGGGDRDLRHRPADAPRGRLFGHDHRRAFPRPGQVRPADDGQRHPLLRRAARDRPLRRRAARRPAAIRRASSPSCPACWSAPGRGPVLPDGTAGHITALFTVLVEGDDHNEPVADAVRGILDGHVILDRRIGEGGRYPAVDVLRSLSRSVPGCLSAEEHALTRRARGMLSLYAEMADLVRLGAYRMGADPLVDEAVAPRAANRGDAAPGAPRGDRSRGELQCAATGHGGPGWRVIRCRPC